MEHKLTRAQLRSYIPLRLEINDQLERIERMKSAERLTAMRMEGGAGHGTADSQAQAIIRRLDYQDKISPKITAALRDLEQIRSAIDRLPDPMERRILRLRYIDIVDGRGLRWREIARKLYGTEEEKDVRAAQRLHGCALKNIPEN